MAFRVIVVLGRCVARRCGGVELIGQVLRVGVDKRGPAGVEVRVRLLWAATRRVEEGPSELSDALLLAGQALRAGPVLLRPSLALSWQLWSLGGVIREHLI